MFLIKTLQHAWAEQILIWDMSMCWTSLDSKFALLLFTGEATEALKALALALPIVEPPVGALSELGEVAEVLIEIHLRHRISRVCACDT